MTDTSKVTPTHLNRTAFVYVRQSTTTQVEHHRESTERQYALLDKACALGWRREQVSIIDEDLGLSGASVSARSDFARMTAEVALGRVGIILGREVSRLARNNPDWYQLLDLCAMTDTLIGDADGLTLDGEQHVEHPQGGRRHGKEIHGGDGILVVSQECDPAFYLVGVDRPARHVT